MSEYFKPVNGIDNGDEIKSKNLEALKRYREQIGQFAANVQSSDKGSIFGFGFSSEQTATQQ